MKYRKWEFFGTSHIRYYMILAPCKIENRIANIRYYMVSSPYNIEYDCFHKILQPRFSILHGLENHVKSEIGIDNRKSAIFDISCDRSNAIIVDNKTIHLDVVQWIHEIIRNIGCAII